MVLTAVIIAVGVLVTTVIGAGLLLIYAAAYAEQAKFEHLQIGGRIRRLMRLMVDDDAL